MRIWTFIRDLLDALPFQVKAIGAALIFGLILLAIVLGQIGACRDRREEHRIANTKEQILTSGVEANVLANQAIEVEINANQANSNLDAVLSTDSGNRDSNFSSVRQRWCEDHPGDSKCVRH